MEIIKSNEYEEVSVILKVGEDFHTYDLYNFMGTKNLSINAESLKRIAKRNGFNTMLFHMDMKLSITTPTKASPPGKICRTAKSWCGCLIMLKLIKST